MRHFVYKQPDNDYVTTETDCTTEKHKEKNKTFYASAMKTYTESRGLAPLILDLGKSWK